MVGLFTGMSILSVVELIFWAFRLLAGTKVEDDAPASNEDRRKSLLLSASFPPKRDLITFRMLGKTGAMDKRLMETRIPRNTAYLEGKSEDMAASGSESGTTSVISI